MFYLGKRYGYIEMGMKKLVVYSAIFGGYDSPKDHYRIPGAEYVMFSDQHFSHPTWKVRTVPTLTIGHQRTNRFYKLHPHQFFPEYEYSLYIDGNWKMTGDLFNVMLEHMGKEFICNPCHPNRGKQDSYDEGAHCIELAKKGNFKAPEAEIRKQLDLYRQAGLPKAFGLWGCQFMLRRHMVTECIQLMTLWWSEIKAATVRDQISYPFAHYMMGTFPACTPGNRLKGIVRKYPHAK
jgi:hypothetical protein